MSVADLFHCDIGIGEWQAAVDMLQMLELQAVSERLFIDIQVQLVLQNKLDMSHSKTFASLGVREPQMAAQENLQRMNSSWGTSGLFVKLT